MEQIKQGASVFLAGATGYLGSRVLDALVADRPDLQVITITRRPEVEDKIRAKGATTVRGDLSEPGAWQDAARAADYVLHVAQPSAFSARGTDKFGKQYGSERMRQERMLLSTLDPARGQRIIYVSGHSYFGATGGALKDETMAPRPIGFGPYITEAVENARREIARGLDVICVYPGAIYAYGSWAKQFVVDPMVSGKKVMVLNAAATMCSPIHVVDCARAVMWMMGVPGNLVDSLGRDYFLVDDQPVSYRDIYEGFAASLGLKLRYMEPPAFIAKLFMGRLNYEYMTTDCTYSNARLHKTGFQFKFPTIATGIPDIVSTMSRA